MNNTIFLKNITQTLKWCCIAIFITLASCDKKTAYELNIPKHFPIPEIPEDNQLTISRVELGKRLFFDPLLSKDSTVSCASCHFPQFAFSDTIPLSKGINGGVTERNSPSLVNVAYVKELFKEGGVPSLEHQVISPLENPAEMGFQLKAAADRLAENPYYQAMAQKAYDRDFTPYVLVRAIGAFERTLIGGTSKYDEYIISGKNKSIFSDSEYRGMELFFNKKTNCSTCHSGVLFTNFKYENNGLYEKYDNVGRADITLDKADKFKFRVSSLRNIEVTAPYMLDGSLSTLEAVVEHYNSGGKNHYQKNELIRPLGLIAEEKADLVAFLKTLTDK